MSSDRDGEVNHIVIRNTNANKSIVFVEKNDPRITAFADSAYARKATINPAQN